MKNVIGSIACVCLGFVIVAEEPAVAAASAILSIALFTIATTLKESNEE